MQSFQPNHPAHISYSAILRKIVMSLLAKGTNLDLIAKLTGLECETIMKMKNKVN